MVSLPIPITKWEKFEAYYIQYDINGTTYNNYRLNINRIRDTDRVADFRKRIEELYGYEPSSYMIAKVYDMKLVTIFNN